MLWSLPFLFFNLMDITGQMLGADSGIQVALNNDYIDAGLDNIQFDARSLYLNMG